MPSLALARVVAIDIGGLAFGVRVERHWWSNEGRLVVTLSSFQVYVCFGRSEVDAAACPWCERLKCVRCMRSHSEFRRTRPQLVLGQPFKSSSHIRGRATRDAVV